MKSWKAGLLATIAVAGSTAVLQAATADAQILDSLRERTKKQQQPQQPAAQQPAAQAPGTQPARNYDISRAERTAFEPVVTAISAQDWAAAQAALPAAQAAARSADGRYLLGQVRLQIGIGINNTAMQSQAIDEMIASGGARPNELQALYENQLAFANQAGDTAKAAAAQAQLDRINPPDPNDPTRLIQQARQRATSDPAGAIQLYQQAMQRQQTAGQPIPVEWRQQIANIAYTARLPQAVGYMREWLIAAPSPALWHDTLAIYAELGSADRALKLDVYRLIRAAGAMTSERDFVELAEAANDVSAFGEVKAVLEEGMRRNLITTNAAYARDRIALATTRIASDRPSLAGERTAALAGSDAAAALRLAEAYYGYGEYAPAAELYRAALQKGPADAGLVNLRLGAALAQAGDRPGAETAFRAVTGRRAELAQFWLLWLSTRS
jgi:hypothetical protein